MKLKPFLTSAWLLLFGCLVLASMLFFMGCADTAHEEEHTR